ncbi:MAG: hypothetical protein M1828_000075 [Chrysothrix sp. TS-e1954]|nr:MAG: hypothetical protein M1828_000075 [Chrysothrix sp. TS-e1954]
MPPPAKRRKTTALEEISFDTADRQDYLTGFRKRKQQRIKHAKEFAAQKERELRIEQRKQMREQRKKDLEKHVETVDKMLKEAEDGVSDGESNAEQQEKTDTEGPEETTAGVNGVVAQDPRREDEYVDEEKYTTVTIKPMDESGSEDENASRSSSEGESHAKEQDQGVSTATKKRVWTKERPAKDKPNKKRKKFRYETKAERKVTRAHEKKNSAASRARRRAKAEQ